MNMIIVKNIFTVKDKLWLFCIIFSETISSLVIQVKTFKDIRKFFY